MAHSSLRFGIGRFTTEAEIDYVVDKITSVVQRLRDMRYVRSHSQLRVYLILTVCRTQPAVGDGSGGYRHQQHRLVAALNTCSPPFSVMSSYLPDATHGRPCYA